MRKGLGLLLALVAGVVSGVPACGAPTQVTFEIRTDVPCGSVKGVAISIGRPGTIELAAPATVTNDCRDGMIGTIATIPSGDKRASIALRVTLGVDTVVENCTAANKYKGCIVARRELAFVADTELEVPVGLYLGCKDVPCDERTTCKVGSGCIPATADPGVPSSSSDAGRDAEALPDTARDVSDGNSDAANTEAVASVVNGTEFTCARFTSGRVKCWGANEVAQLGTGDTVARGASPTSMGDALPYVDLGTGRTARAIAAGAFHACAILDDTNVKCWGFGSFGQTGLGQNQPQGDTPGEMGNGLPNVGLGAGRTAKTIAAGEHFTCAVLDNDKVKCWGLNTDGQLGLGDTEMRGDEPGEMGDALAYVDLGAGRTAKFISVGRNHACAILDNDQVKCWGANSAGQLGLGDVQNRGDGPSEMGDALPYVDLGTGRTAKKISAAKGDHTCAILDNDKVKCWGANDSGALGQGDSLRRGDGPGEMGDALPYVDLGAGLTPRGILAGSGYMTCSILGSDRLKCWGQNGFGELGLGDTQTRGDGPGEMGDALPYVDLGTGRSVSSLSDGGPHTCAVLDNGRVKCWGPNSKGQLGLGDNSSRGDSPAQMGDALPYVKLVGP